MPESPSGGRVASEGGAMRRLMAVAGTVAAVSVVASMTLAGASNSGARKASWWSLVSSAPTAASGDNDGEERLVLVERNATETDIDNPPAGFSAGDEVAFAGDLYLGGKKVGYDDGHAIFTLVSQDQVRVHATFTATVRGDEINAAGSVTFTETAVVDFELSVTGGTGRYDDVGGEVTIVEQGQTVKLVFDLEHFD
jgi:hypothetical protein